MLADAGFSHIADLMSISDVLASQKYLYIYIDVYDVLPLPRPVDDEGSRKVLAYGCHAGSGPCQSCEPGSAGNLLQAGAAVWPRF